jgi:acyl-CoA thioesterase FadM
VNLAFVSPVFFGTKIVVETEVTKIEGAAATVDFAFRHPVKDKVFAKGSATYHLVDLRTKRPVDVPPREADIFLSRQD